MSKGILLDTTVISQFTAKSGPSPKMVEWFSELDQRLYISAINYYEVIAGLHEIHAFQTAEKFKGFLKTLSIEILPVTLEISEQAAIERGRGKVKRQVRKMADLLIGATAYNHGLALATANVKDFSFWEIEVIDPA